MTTHHFLHRLSLGFGLCAALAGTGAAAQPQKLTTPLGQTGGAVQASPRVLAGAAPVQSASGVAAQGQKVGAPRVAMPLQKPVHQKFTGQAALQPRVIDVAQSNAALSARFASLVLDESDRAALRLDAAAFARLVADGVAPPAAAAPPRPVHPPRAGSLSGQTAELKVKPQSAISICEMAGAPEPRLSQVIVPAGELTPGIAFALKGSCLGDKPGAVQVSFQGTGQVVMAQVVSWQPFKVHAVLPASITRVRPTQAQIVVTTAAGRATPPVSHGFWPRWHLVGGVLDLRAVSCPFDMTYPVVRSRCTVAEKGIVSPGFEFPARCRGLCVHTEFGVDYSQIYGVHYTDEDIEVRPAQGTDRYAIDLPSYAMLASWEMEGESFDPGRNTLRTEWNSSTRELLVHWTLGTLGEAGMLIYQVYSFRVWMPLGINLH